MSPEVDLRYVAWARDVRVVRLVLMFCSSRFSDHSMRRLPTTEGTLAT